MLDYAIPWRLGPVPYEQDLFNSMETTEGAVTLEPVTHESASVLQNLFELYAYDFSEQMSLQIQASGRFEITPGEEWWTRDDHFAHLIKVQRELAGFALARRGSRLTNASDVMDVAEFFVLRSNRRKGVGERAAHALFKTFDGGWEVRVRRTNVAALAFWSRVAERWVGHPVATSPYAIEGVDWNVLRFATPNR